MKAPVMSSAHQRAACAALLLALLAPPIEVWAQAAPSLLQRIRALIGLNRKIPVAAGGSRGGGAAAVCVIAPRTSVDSQGHATAVVPLPRPTILAAEPLNEVRILRGQQLLWQQRASSTQAIEGPIRWPLAPMQAGEELTLQLRPRGAGGGDFASVSLKGTPAAEQQAAEAEVQRLGANPAAWLQSVDQALSRGQVSLAWALLYSPQDPRSADLDGLRQEVFRRGCRS